MVSVENLSTVVLPDGFTLRPARLEDAEAAHAVVVAHHGASGGNEAPPLSEVVTDLSYPTLDLERDTFLVDGPDGALVLYGIAYTETPDRVFFDLFIDPALPRSDALAVGGAIASRAVELTGSLAREKGFERAIAETGMVFGDELLPEILTPVGLRPARLWWRMQADVDVLRAAVAMTPAGYRIERQDLRDDATLRTTLDLRNTTFHDHYGHVPMEWEKYERIVRTSASFDPTALWFATDERTGEVAGFLRGDDSRAEVRTGYVSTLGVLSAHRGRGLGGALLRTAFAAYAERGFESVLLGVDTENSTGAVGVYEGVGMTVLDVLQTWERELTLRP